MTEILVAGSSLLQFGQYTDGSGSITQNQDGSMTCKASDTNSRAYLYYKRPINFGETIIVKIKGKALSETPLNDSSPRCNIIWYRKDGSTQGRVVNGNFFNYTDFTEETIMMNINQPVEDGDYVQVGFGSFASSTIDSIIQSASVSIVNSMLPTKRIALQALIKIPASSENVTPVPVINNNFNRVGDMSFSFENGMLKISSPSLINVSYAFASGNFAIEPILDFSGEYRKYYPTIGQQDRDNGAVYVSFTDRNTNEAVDLTKIANSDLFYQFNYEVL